MSDPARETVQPSGGQWARDIADTYRRIAEGETWEPRRVANEAAAREYDAIADRMDRIVLTRPPGQVSDHA